MFVAQYFVEFIFYSFLGWVWESVYCTIQKKEWQDRGFLFGPICPIYGSCIVVTKLLFQHVKFLASPDFPIWGIFLICMIGSAIAEFSTSWVLEKRFHAMWWDYSHLPLNLQGRICLPVSTAFGLAGVVVVKVILPYISSIHMVVHPILDEVLAIGFAMIFGADYALTEASLSSLLKNIENYKAEWNKKAEETYNTIASAPRKLEEGVTLAKETVSGGMSSARATVAEGVSNAKETVVGGMMTARETVAGGMTSARESVAGGTERIRALTDSYIERLNPSQIRIFNNIERFRGNGEEEKKISGLSMTEHLRNALKLKRHYKSGEKNQYE